MPGTADATGPQTVSEPGRLAVVTGAGGFIGSHLVEALLRGGYRVWALVHYNALGSRKHLQEVIAAGRETGEDWVEAGRLEVVFGDVQDPRCMRDLVRGADCVFHLAALIGIPYSYTAPQSYLNVNVQGTLNLLEACREAGVGRFMHTSTSEALGTAQVTPQDETHPLQAQSPYSATKIAADKLVESYVLSFDLPGVVIRPFNTFGPRQSARAVVPSILSQALSPGCDAIRLGALDPVRDLTYVEDTVAGFLAAAEAPADRVVGRLFHLGTGEGISIGELAREICEVLGSDKPILQDSERMRPGASEVRALVCDAGRLREATGWTPRVPRREGLRRTADWVRRHLDLYRPDEYTR